MGHATDQPAPQHSPGASTPKTVAHANGLTFKVIDGNSSFARVARNIRTLEMADGSTWTVGLPIGWRGTEAAWQPVETPEQTAARIHAYGQSMARHDQRQLGLHTATGDRQLLDAVEEARLLAVALGDAVGPDGVDDQAVAEIGAQARRAHTSLRNTAHRALRH